MTREEAIERLDLCQNVCNDCLTCASHDEALDMAIAALREQDSNANQHVSNTSNTSNTSNASNASNALESFKQKTEADTVKGCKLCNSARFDIAVQTRDPDDMYVFSSDPVIGAMFCPLCGRRLEDA